MFALSKGNMLGFPSGRNPGIDPTHFASKGLKFSAIAAQGGFINLTNGAVAALTGSIVNKTYGSIGPSSGLAAAGVRGTFSGFTAALDASATFAVIYISTNIGTNQYPIAYGNGGAGPALNVNSNVLKWNNWGGSNPTAGVSVSGLSNIPLLLMGSVSAYSGSGICNLLAARLDTGAVVTSTSAAVAGTTPNGSINLLESNANGLSVPGFLAAAMYAANFMSLVEMAAFAADPWAFWYPRRLDPFLYMLRAPSGSAFTLSAAEGVYTLTGKPQTLNAARTIAAAQGSYTVNGQAQTLNRGRTMPAAQGTYTLNGQVQTLGKGRTLSAAQGTYILTGEPQFFGIGMPAAQGSYALSGKPQGFAVALSLLAQEGVYSLTGEPAALIYTPAGGGITPPHGPKFFADVGSLTSR